MRLRVSAQQVRCDGLIRERWPLCLKLGSRNKRKRYVSSYSAAHSTNTFRAIRLTDRSPARNRLFSPVSNKQFQDTSGGQSGGFRLSPNARSSDSRNSPNDAIVSIELAGAHIDLGFDRGDPEEGDLIHKGVRGRVEGFSLPGEDINDLRNRG